MKTLNCFGSKVSKLLIRIKRILCRYINNKTSPSLTWTGGAALAGARGRRMFARGVTLQLAFRYYAGLAREDPTRVVRIWPLGAGISKHAVMDAACETQNKIIWKIITMHHAAGSNPRRAFFFSRFQFYLANYLYLPTESFLLSPLSNRHEVGTGDQELVLK